MLYGVHIHNEVLDSKHIVFGVRARNFKEAILKANEVYNFIAPKENIAKHVHNQVSVTSGFETAGQILEWAGIDSGFAYGKYKDKPFMRVRFTNTVPSIKGGYIRTNDKSAPSTISTLVQYF